MKRFVLLLALAVFAVGFAAVPQSGERVPAQDGKHRIAYAIDSITGEYLFAEDVEPLFFNTSRAFPRATFAPLGNSIQMNRITVIPAPGAGDILSAAHGLDFDNDGKREFVIRRGISIEDTPFEFYESTSDNSFHLVHVLDIENCGSDTYRPADAGDIDGDGLADLVLKQAR
jgi:hypothetical protein